MTGASLGIHRKYENCNDKLLWYQRIVIVTFSVLLLAFFFFFLLSHSHNRYDHSNNPKGRLAMSSKSLYSACGSTIYPIACINSLSSYPSSQNASPLQLVHLGSKAALSNVGQALSLAKYLSTTEHGHGLERAALQDCRELLDDASFHLNNTILQLSNLVNHTFQAVTAQEITNIKIWLSTALTFQETCMDGLVGLRGSLTNQMKVKQEEVSQVVTNALYLLTNFGKDSKKSISATQYRRLLSDNLPSWLSASDRKLLQFPSSIGYNAVVAQDGSGEYTTIQSAVESIPNNYSGRYVIYIKQGTYNEIVTISKALKNITFLGDGINETIITGNRNVASGLYTTFSTATVAISGQGFIGKGITFQNTAGASGHQAVALRAGADHVVFDKCSFEGYQDTLYALSSRQFYKDCKIYGTVDFIFGNAAAVFQNCELLARQPMQGQQNTYTAQGRKVEDDPTGFSFQNCTVTASQDLQTSNYSVLTYLGRPWKAYSTTVFLKSYLDDLIQPTGWLAWNSSDPFEDTLYYGEYENDGPGAGTSERVSWSGVHSNMSYQEASIFSAENFISGTSWLSEVDVEVEETVPY